ncbi:MAG: hypothetical protein J7M03_03515 [Candidatus Desulfofervidaceae bacterium]|nr:hypothetical protein [Candidatus Desulfofervidaceae bacterium]MDL1970261.1 hypothetical protein [Candidatus Desulfofervidaceae bacterium]
MQNAILIANRNQRKSCEQGLLLRKLRPILAFYELAYKLLLNKKSKGGEIYGREKQL